MKTSVHLLRSPCLIEPKTRKVIDPAIVQDLFKKIQDNTNSEIGSIITKPTSDFPDFSRSVTPMNEDCVLH